VAASNAASQARRIARFPPRIGDDDDDDDDDGEPGGRERDVPTEDGDVGEGAAADCWKARPRATRRA
jgi:hypothetical protein